MTGVEPGLGVPYATLRPNEKARGNGVMGVGVNGGDALAAAGLILPLPQQRLFHDYECSSLIPQHRLLHGTDKAMPPSCKFVLLSSWLQ